MKKNDQPPLSREDALAERLRILRNSSQPETPKQSHTNSLSASASGGPPTSSSGICGPAQPQCSATQLGDDIQTTNSQKILLSSTAGGNRSINDPENPVDNSNDDDYLQYLESGGDPDQTLDELLDGLDEEFDLDDDDNALSGFDPAKEAKKVSKLLEQFQKDNNTSGGVPTADEQRGGHAVTGRVPGKAPQRAPPAGDGDHDDDTENEQMTGEAEKIISRVRDELRNASEDKKEDDKNNNTGEAGISAPANDSEADARTSPTTEEPSEEKTGSNPADIASSLALPDAPASPLRDIVTTTEGSKEGESRKSFDFENDIVTRLASLKGLGSGINTDAFGLPAAPTFSPQDHTKKTNTKKVKSTGGYTDEDQKTWCIVCLDDATIKCIGCDSDVYCGRCWRDMHVGPSAGYDERGHQWVKIVR